MTEPEIQTMKKDIERMKKKAAISETDEISLPTGELLEKLPTAPASPARLAAKRAGGSSEKLPGAPLPSEPMILTKSLKSIKPPELKSSFITPESEIEETRCKKIFNRKIIILAIILVVVLLICMGVYYWLVYLRT